MGVYGKWLELFGEPLDLSCVPHEDKGDEITYHMLNGYSVTFACDGNYIHQERAIE